MSLISDLRKDQLHQRHPERHVFRITRQQEQEIIADIGPAFGFNDVPKIEHINSLFGCKVELLD